MKPMIAPANSSKTHFDNENLCDERNVDSRDKLDREADSDKYIEDSDKEPLGQTYEEHKPLASGELDQVMHHE